LPACKKNGFGKAKYGRNIITSYINTNVIELSTLIYYYSTITLLLLLLLSTCMEGIYNYIPETNYVLRGFYYYYYYFVFFFLFLVYLTYVSVVHTVQH